MEASWWNFMALVSMFLYLPHGSGLWTWETSQTRPEAILMVTASSWGDMGISIDYLIVPSTLHAINFNDLPLNIRQPSSSFAKPCLESDVMDMNETLFDQKKEYLNI